MTFGVNRLSDFEIVISETRIFDSNSITHLKMNPFVFFSYTVDCRWINESPFSNLSSFASFFSFFCHRALVWNSSFMSMLLSLLLPWLQCCSFLQSTLLRHNRQDRRSRYRRRCPSPESWNVRRKCCDAFNVDTHANSYPIICPRGPNECTEYTVDK